MSLEQYSMPSGRGLKEISWKVLIFGLIPLVVYFLVFCALSYPLITKFSTHFLIDDGDGFLNVWNIWWINKAVTELHQNPWTTTYLQFPHGTSLLGHTMIPFKGFMAIPLLRIFPFIQTFNICVIFAFVVGGLTAFWLAYTLSRSYAGSLVAGFIFTFCSYHFAHAAGHLNLASIEWIPLFVLAWYILMTRPSLRIGIGAALALFLVTLCDYYYFLYCVITAAVIYVWKALREKKPFLAFKRGYLLPLLGFGATALLTSGPLVASLFLLNRHDPMVGAHPTSWFSLDLPSLFIPGGHWRFASWTKFYWSKLPGNINESSVHMGLALIFILVFVWVKRRSVRMESLRLWYALIALFILLSMGPVLQLWGKPVPWVKLPYALLEAVFPPLKLSGVPVRMVIISMLAAGIVLAAGFKDLFGATVARRGLAAGLVVLLVFEYIPKPMWATRVTVPAYVQALKELPGTEGIIDQVASPPYALYYQTIHEKPMAFGYIARIPGSVERRNARIAQLIKDREWGVLSRGYHFRYIVASGPPLKSSPKGGIKTVFDDGQIRIYEIK